MSHPSRSANVPSSHASPRSSPPMLLCILPALLCWLIATGFAFHGLLLAGEYIVNNSPGSLSSWARWYLIAIIVAPIAVAGLSFLAGCAWIASPKKWAPRSTILTALAIVAYAVWFLNLIL